MLRERRGEGFLNIQKKKIRRQFECSFLFIQSFSSYLSHFITFFSFFIVDFLFHSLIVFFLYFLSYNGFVSLLLFL
jgi:hypothetical protein